ncbi:antibiotic biosynthesis monooxygenase family protein [Bacillus cereus]|uniref:antibiotic biosynthesis monooxygenase family protein n=1 Tax=Bacillus cereus TaxID=1396 RepID=UPI000BEC7979|nr:antibiotic biosynthesis monooxygenase [Bacillus cereus]PEF61713.1 antibiotic biosynthesis monooxygenase [Bacillus cereus]
MILEIASLFIKPDNEVPFEDTFKKMTYLLNSAKGYKSHTLCKSLEVEQKYNLFIQWEHLENHTVDFIHSKPFAQWIESLQPFFTKEPIVEHFQLKGMMS